MDVVSGVIAPAMGVALSPFPIIAVILLLAAPNARQGGPGFLLGWVVGLCLGVGLLIVVSNLFGLGPNEASPPTWVSIVRLALGVGLLVWAAQKFLKRPRGDDEVSLPGWLASLPTKTPSQLVQFGAMLSGLNPKNLMFNIVAAGSIASMGVSVRGEIVAWLAYIVLASVTVAIPVVWYLVAPQSATAALAGPRRWVERNNVLMLTAILFLIGLSQLQKALQDLF